jgi:uncharacterized protein (DUF433 family)
MRFASLTVGSVIKFGLNRTRGGCGVVRVAPAASSNISATPSASGRPNRPTLWAASRLGHRLDPRAASLYPMTQPESRLALGEGIYTTGEIAKLARMAPQRVRRWVRGYSYRDRVGVKRRAGEVIQLSFGLGEGPAELSFHDLLEILFVKKFLAHGVSMPTIRKAAAAAAHDFETIHPFSLRRFETDGRRVFARVNDELGDEHLYDLVSRQVGFSEVMSPLFKQIDYEPDEAVRWHPLGRREPVVVDPRRSFGAPVTAKSSIPTNAIFAAHRAGESFEKIARWYGASVREVKAAIELERASARGRAA